VANSNERVVALAGRRIDAIGARPVRFPLEHVAYVAGQLRALLRSRRARVLVCAAANGADLVALHVARELGMRCRIVLPFSPTRFRRVSVTDRPGGELWGWLYDDLIARARANRDLVVTGSSSGGDAAAFAAANKRILIEALRFSPRRHLPGRVQSASRASVPPLAVIVWEGQPRRAGDATAGFAELARASGLRVKSVRTCPS
jgi:hypothetical protein